MQAWHESGHFVISSICRSLARGVKTQADYYDAFGLIWL
jgi:hypothetical protein